MTLGHPRPTKAGAPVAPMGDQEVKLEKGRTSGLGRGQKRVSAVIYGM